MAPMAAFGPIAKQVICVEPDGPLARDYRKMVYAKVKRPIWLPMRRNPVTRLPD